MSRTGQLPRRITTFRSPSGPARLAPNGIAPVNDHSEQDESAQDLKGKAPGVVQGRESEGATQYHKWLDFRIRQIIPEHVHTRTRKRGVLGR